MKIKDKINLDIDGLVENGPINIVAFGDSVTHGAVKDTEISYETVYHNLLKNKIHEVRNYVPINVINAGIGGDCAANAVKRFDRDVAAHNPDLIIVCFGLNDINGELDVYISALKQIFKKCMELKAETVFMTPNMLNTYVDAENTEEQFLGYAEVTAQTQNSGKMDEYMAAAVKTAEEMNIPVCDCYARWKEMYRSGTDTTKLLANRINHPTKEMHNLFADMLFDIVMKGAENKNACESTMYQKK